MKAAAMNRYVYDAVLDWIPERARVLDLGSGDGGFLERLVDQRGVRGEGVEKDPEMVARCIERGMVVHQGDILDGLDQYGPETFDYILLLGTFQELVSPLTVLEESFRVSRYVIIGYHNLAYWRYRGMLTIGGKSPRSGQQRLPWYESPNVQFFSLLDFHDFCQAKGIRPIRSSYFHARGALKWFPNLRASEVLSLIALDAD